METLKQEAIRVISKLPDTANIEDIMYELYVIDKVKKGREAVAEDEAAFEAQGQTVMEVPTEMVPAIRDLIAKHKVA